MISTNCMENFSLNNIIICIAESPQNESPKFVDIDQILAGNYSSSANNNSRNVVVINTKKNSFDWTALHMLSVYREDPLVDSDYYLYLLG